LRCAAVLPIVQKFYNCKSTPMLINSFTDPNNPSPTRQYTPGPGPTAIRLVA
jgi:hypothetical protein